MIHYGSLYQKVWRAAAALHAQGIRPGDRVALWMTNRPELVECYLGCFLAGAVIMPVFNKMTEHELRPLLAHSSPTLLISELQLLGTIESATPLAPAVWSVDGAASGVTHPSGEILDYQSLMEVARPEQFSPPHLTDEAAASLMYTSGTTGEPKGAVHLRRNHAANIANQHALVRQDHSDEVLVFLSVCHTFGFLRALLPALSAGSTVVLLRQFEPAAAVEALAAHPITLMYGLPEMYVLLLDELEHHPHLHVGSLRNAMIAGDAVPLALHQRFGMRMGLLLQEEYAMTETMMIAANPVGRAKVIGSLGRVLPGMAVRIRESEGTPASPGEIGEIEVRGNTALSHYFRNEAANAEAFDDGWLRTGDLGSLDDQGNLWFRGRIKQIIVHGGENIAPAEVEAAFHRHPEVLEVAVIGVPDATSGQRLVAYVATTAKSTVNAEVLSAFVRDYIADFKVPSEILLLSELPTGETGKIDHAALLRRYQADHPASG
ncbi:MAG: acyl--CoA ligase [Actinobacteria bacterium]|nr:acyl--CoA ligase [Actinomycetota bacterium]MCB9413159.1 acyl--CoA ligase [Actinomycetota bacterium]